MKINLKSLKVKIFIFYIASFTMLFGVILSINYFIFEDFAKDSEVKKAQTIAELIASNIAVPLQLGLVEEVKGEVYKQAETNKNILEISILELEGGKKITVSKNNFKKPTDSHFIIKKEIMDSLMIRKTAIMEMVYSDEGYLTTKSFAAKTLFVIFGVAMLIGLFALLKLDDLFGPLKDLTNKLSNFNPEHPSVNLETTSGEDEISVIQNTVSLAIEKLIAHQQKIIHINEDLEDAVRDRTRELNEQIELFRVLAEASPNAIALFDTNIIYANPAFSHITGYNQSELFRKDVKSLFVLDMSSDFCEVLNLNNNSCWIMPCRVDEIEIFKKDGTKCYVSASVSYLHIKERDAAIINLVDLTDIKQKDQMLLLQSRFIAMGEMIGNIAHQWRQPLNIIQSSITKVGVYKEMGLVTNNFLDETVERVKRQVEYLSSTIDDFRHFYKDEPDGTFALSQTVSRAMSLVEAAYTNHFISLEFVDGTKNIWINGSENRLIQAVLNILNNSKDAIIASDVPDKAVIITSNLSSDKESAILEILDTGGGIEQKNLSKIFDPYFTTKHKSQGTGIGLYMTKQIITGSFKARIEAENMEFEYKNKLQRGALFRIEFKLV